MQFYSEKKLFVTWNRHRASPPPRGSIKVRWPSVLDFPGQSFISGSCPGFHSVLDLKSSEWPSLENAFGQLILGKIIKTVVTRCQISRLKCAKFDFGWGSVPDPTGEAYSAPPDPLAGLRGPTFKAKEGREKKGRDRRERERGGGEGIVLDLPLKYMVTLD